MVDGIAEDAAGGSPGLNLDVGVLVLFLARELDADVVDDAVASLDFARSSRKRGSRSSAGRIKNSGSSVFSRMAARSPGISIVLLLGISATPLSIFSTSRPVDVLTSLCSASFPG